MITVFGIPNCDTVKKARVWLTAHGYDCTFHDFKKQGVPAHLLPQWVQAVGWETLLNRQGTTWRKLDAQQQSTIIDAASALACMQTHPSVIKRPVVQWANGAISVGFKPEIFARHAPPLV